MQTRWLILGLLVLATQALAEDGRYEALPLAGADGGKGGGRALILDTRDGYVWVWSENELLNSPNGQRRYGSGFIYQGKLHPGTKPGEIIEQQSR
jgi:hypothetical protein